jgi:hypothetical protein
VSRRRAIDLQHGVIDRQGFVPMLQASSITDTLHAAAPGNRAAGCRI